MEERIENGGTSWQETAHRIAILSARVSLLLSASVSRPGVRVVSGLAGNFFTEELFGANTIFAVNPWHPRHVISFVAVALALPAIFCWSDKDLCPKALFNTVTSRPFLHQVNKFFI